MRTKSVNLNKVRRFLVRKENKDKEDASRQAAEKREKNYGVASEPRLEHVYQRRDSRAPLDMGLKTHKWKESHWSWKEKPVN